MHGGGRTGWQPGDELTTLPLMQQQLRVDTAVVRTMASRWAASVGELNATMAPAGLGLSCQPSATAVNAAHAHIAAFTSALGARVGLRAAHVAEADTRYIVNETRSANQLAAVAHPVIDV